MLERLEVDNYKCLVGFEIDLDELTLLLGVNGTGKSSVLDVVLAIRQLLSGGCRVTDATVFPASTLTRWDDGRRQSVEMRVRLGGETFTDCCISCKALRRPCSWTNRTTMSHWPRSSLGQPRWQAPAARVWAKPCCARTTPN